MEDGETKKQTGYVIPYIISPFGAATKKGKKPSFLVTNVVVP